MTSSQLIRAICVADEGDQGLRLIEYGADELNCDLLLFVNGQNELTDGSGLRRMATDERKNASGEFESVPLSVINGSGDSRMGALSVKHPVSDLPKAILALNTGILRRTKGNRELNGCFPRRQMPALALIAGFRRRQEPAKDSLLSLMMLTHSPIWRTWEE